MLAHKSEEILIRTRRNIFGSNAGGNPSIFAGNGLDFAELKEYTIGDDVRTLNWKVTAREQRPFVNVFNEERELNIVCVYLESGSIFFGSQRFKQEVMAEALSLISYSALKNDDRVSTLVFSDKEEFFLPPTRALGSLHVTVPEVLGRDPLGKRVDFAALVDHLNGRVRQRSLIFLIGDFYGDGIDLSLLARHEVYAIIVRDRFEENPALSGEIGLLDAQSMEGTTLELSPALAARYRAALEARDKVLVEHLASHRITATKLYTDEEPFVKLSALFRR
ncbi:DUF58 domain-containing protein [Sulfurimonas sp. HSL1-6]|uniref:DUF58 domain-containing protein n=1 Tax=Thiomicrolovo immobilis TaxID=3131935 RepID=UPI0031F73EEC